MKVSFVSKLLLIVAASLAVAACGKLEYDWKGLGFASEAEMEAAHKIGYHTKAKLDEMRPKLAVAQMPAPVPIAQVPESAAAAVTPAAPVAAQAPTEAPPPPAAAVVVAEEKPASPSFDCAKASSDVERMICGDNKLADLDRRFSDGYRMTIEGMKPEEKARMKAEQIKWLKTERNVCKDKACIAGAYESRIRELTGD